MDESTLDMMQFDHLLGTLKFQIYAYEKCKAMDHQTLMGFNLYAINSLCRSIFSVLEAEERRKP